MAGRSAAGALLALAACFAYAAAAPTINDHNALELYGGDAVEGCYYNFQHYSEGDRIMTNEPCLNCTCHNRMLMCYLRVCPFTKPIGHDCTVEKRADQCCPIVTCPHVPVDLLTSTEALTEYGGTGVDRSEKYGCSINGRYYSEGSKVPSTPNKPCEHCYCIRNMTTCVMQECTLHVDGCTPIYHKDVCCPVRYSCDHPEDEIPKLEDMTTTVRPTPGFILPTTVSSVSQECVHNDETFADGALIKTEKACEHCYCMKGDIVCVVQECGTPMENEGKNCTSVPPREGQCCPDTYICEGDNEILEEHLTTLGPKIDVEREGSGYEKEDEQTGILEMEGSGFGEISESPVEITSKIPDEFEISHTSTRVPLTPSIIIDETESEDQFFTTPSQDHRKHVISVSGSEETSSSTVEPDQGENTVPHGGLEEEVTSTIDLQETPASSEAPYQHEIEKATTTKSIIDETKFSEEPTSEIVTTLGSIPIVTQATDDTVTEGFVAEKPITPRQQESEGLSSTSIGEQVTTFSPEMISEIITHDMYETSTSTVIPDHKDVSSEIPTEKIQAATDEATTEISATVESQTVTEKEFFDKKEPIEHKKEEEILQTDTDGFTTQTVTYAITEMSSTTSSETVPPGIIPGEGACLVDGVTYDNQSMVPRQDKCHESCKCMSSIVKCDTVQCSPPPENMINCVPEYDSESTCCPAYTCDHPKETIPPQPESQMAVTEKVSIKEDCGEKCVKETEDKLLECKGNECEVQEEAIKPDKSSELCSSGYCNISEVLVTSEQKPCDTEDCSSEPTPSCEGDNCETSSIQPLEITQEPSSRPVECSGSSCETRSEPPINQICENGLDCKPVEEYLVPDVSCEGEICKSKDEKVPCEKEGGCDYIKPDTTISLCDGESCAEEQPTISSDDSQSALPCKNGSGCEHAEPGVEVPTCDDESCAEPQPLKPSDVPSPECKTNNCLPTSQGKPDSAVRKEDSCSDDQECKLTTSEEISSEECKGSDCALPDSYVTDKVVTLDQSFTKPELVKPETTLGPELTTTSYVSKTPEYTITDLPTQPDEGITPEVKKETEVSFEDITNIVETTTPEIEKYTSAQLTSVSFEHPSKEDSFTPDTDKATKATDEFEPEAFTTVSNIFTTGDVTSVEKIESSTLEPESVTPIKTHETPAATETSTVGPSTFAIESDKAPKSPTTITPEKEIPTEEIGTLAPESERGPESTSTLRPATTSESDVLAIDLEKSTELASLPEKAESVVPETQTSAEFTHVTEPESVSEDYTTESVHLSSLETEKPIEKIEISQHDIEKPTEKIEIPDQDIEKSTEKIEISDQDIEKPTEKIEVSDKDVEKFTDRTAIPDRELESSTELVTTSTPEIEITTTLKEYTEKPKTEQEISSPEIEKITLKPDTIPNEEIDITQTTETVDISISETVKPTEPSRISESDIKQTEDISTPLFETEISTESTPSPHIDVKKPTETLVTFIPEIERQPEISDITESEAEKEIERSTIVAPHLEKSTESSPIHITVTEEISQTDTLVTKAEGATELEHTSESETLRPITTTHAPYTNAFIEKGETSTAGVQISTEVSEYASDTVPETESPSTSTEFSTETRKPVEITEGVEVSKSDILSSTEFTKLSTSPEIQEFTHVSETTSDKSETLFSSKVTEPPEISTISKKQSTDIIYTSAPEIEQSTDIPTIVIAETEKSPDLTDTTIEIESTEKSTILEIEKTTKSLPTYTQESTTSIESLIHPVEKESEYFEKEQQMPITTSETSTDHGMDIEQSVIDKTTEKTDNYEKPTDHSAGEYEAPETTSVTSVVQREGTEVPAVIEEFTQTSEDHEIIPTTNIVSIVDSMSTEEQSIVTEKTDIVTSDFDETKRATDIPEEEKVVKVSTSYPDVERKTDIPKVVPEVTEKERTELSTLEDITTSSIPITTSTPKEDEKIKEVLPTTTEFSRIAQEDTTISSSSSPKIFDETTSTYETETKSISSEKEPSEEIVTVSESLEKATESFIKITEHEISEIESTTAFIVELEEHPHEHHKDTSTITIDELKGEEDYLVTKEKEESTTHKHYEDTTYASSVEMEMASVTPSIEPEVQYTTAEAAKHTVSEDKIIDEHISVEQTTLLPETLQSFSPLEENITQLNASALPVFDSKKETAEEKIQYQTPVTDILTTEMSSIKPIDDVTESVPVTQIKDQDKTSEVFTTTAGEETVIESKKPTTSEERLSTATYETSETSTQVQFDEHATAKITESPFIVTPTSPEVESATAPQVIPEDKSTTIKTEEIITTSSVSGAITEATAPSLITSEKEDKVTTSKPMETDLTTIIYGETTPPAFTGFDDTISESVEGHIKPIEEILKTTISPAKETYEEPTSVSEEESSSFITDGTERVPTVSSEQLYTEKTETSKPALSEIIPVSHEEGTPETETEKSEDTRVGGLESSTILELKPSSEQSSTISYSEESGQYSTKTPYETEQTEGVTDKIQTLPESATTLEASSAGDEVVTKETLVTDKEEQYTKTTPEIEIRVTDETEAPTKAEKPEELTTKIPEPLSTTLTQEVEEESEKKPTEPPIKITSESIQFAEGSSETPADHDKPEEVATLPPMLEEAQKPDKIYPSTSSELPSPDEDTDHQMQDHFPPSASGGYETENEEDDQAFGPGTCRYGGKVYVSAQQIPRDDPCDFCFCFRSDIICLQQSCPPPIHGCHEEPIEGFCCPRYECPVSMATTLNVTTTTTTTTTTLPPHFLPHAYKGAALKRGCQIKGYSYNVGEVIKASSGPCMHCTCGGDGQMKCDPKACTPEPMLRQMIAAAVSSKRRR